MLVLCPILLVEACRPKWDLEEFASRHSEHWALDAVSDHDLDETAHYCRYAFAAYGYLLYIWSQPQYKCGPCCLLCPLLL